MSPLGRSLFDMMNGINQAYLAQHEVERLAALPKPVIISPIKRASQTVKS